MEKNLRIHFWYIIGILVAVIVALVTVKWSEIPSLASYLSFALGVTSLVLAVVAIIYAFFTNSSFAATVSKIESAAASVKDETSKLEKAVDGLDTHVRAIPEAIRSVEVKVAETHELIRASSQQPSTEIQAPKPIQNEEFVKGVIEYFVSISSWNGVKVIYLCLLACEKQKEFDLAEWSKGDAVTSYDYAYGYLVATSSVGFFTHTMDGSKVKVQTMIRQFADRIREEIAKRVKDAPLPHNEYIGRQVSHIEEFIKKTG